MALAAQQELQGCASCDFPSHSFRFAAFDVQEMALAAQRELQERALRIEARLAEAQQRRAARLELVRERAALGAVPGVTTSSSALTPSASTLSFAAAATATATNLTSGLQGGGGVAAEGGGGGTPPRSPQGAVLPPRGGGGASASSTGQLGTGARRATATGGASGRSWASPLGSPAGGVPPAPAGLVGPGGSGLPAVARGSVDGAVAPVPPAATGGSGSAIAAAAAAVGQQIQTGGGSVTSSINAKNRLKRMRRRAAKLLARIQEDRCGRCHVLLRCCCLLSTLYVLARCGVSDGREKARQAIRVGTKPSRPRGGAACVSQLFAGAAAAVVGAAHYA